MKKMLMIGLILMSFLFCVDVNAAYKTYDEIFKYLSSIVEEENKSNNCYEYSLEKGIKSVTSTETDVIYINYVNKSNDSSCPAVDILKPIEIYYSNSKVDYANNLYISNMDSEINEVLCSSNVLNKELLLGEQLAYYFGLTNSQINEAITEPLIWTEKDSNNNIVFKGASSYSVPLTCTSSSSQGMASSIANYIGAFTVLNDDYVKISNVTQDSITLSYINLAHSSLMTFQEITMIQGKSAYSIVELGNVYEDWKNIEEKESDNGYKSITIKGLEPYSKYSFEISNPNYNFDVTTLKKENQSSTSSESNSDSVVKGENVKEETVKDDTVESPKTGLEDYALVIVGGILLVAGCVVVINKNKKFHRI